MSRTLIKLYAYWWVYAPFIKRRHAMKHQLQNSQNLFITYQLVKCFRLIPVLILGVMLTISNAYATDPTSIPKEETYNS